jgi:NADH-quinone oxidoreductase subunit K
MINRLKFLKSLIIHQISTNYLLFIIGFLGVTLNYNSFLIALIGIEIMLLSTSLNFICYSLYFNDIYGQIFSIFILTVAAAEAAVGLALLIVYYKLKNTIDMNDNSKNKG